MRIFIHICLLMTLLLTASCNKVYTWHQKLTVTVQTPTGEVSGYSVTEITKTHSDSWYDFPEARGVRSDVRGEAVVVEVAPGEYLFVLLDDMESLAYHTFTQFPYTRDSEFDSWARSIERHRGSAEVPQDAYPTMVTFGDIDDPMTMFRISPSNLTRVFGDGFDVVSMNLEVTDDPVTEGNIATAASWINDLAAYQTIDGNPFTNTLPPEIRLLKNNRP
jgi:hypothetical protein